MALLLSFAAAFLLLAGAMLNDLRASRPQTFAGASPSGEQLLVELASLRRQRMGLTGVTLFAALVTTGLLVAGSVRRNGSSETTFRSLLEAAPDAVVIVDEAGHIILVNNQAEQLFGYPRAELMGAPVELLIPQRFRAKHPGQRKDYAVQRRARRPMGSGLELYGRHKDGHEFPVEISLGRLETENGIYVSSAIRDVSERKAADEQRFRLAAIVESSGDAIIGKTLQGIITSWNQGAERIFGYTSEEILGKSVSVLIPREREREESEILASLARGERIDQFDTVRRRKDGSEIHVSLTASPVRDAQGALIGASKIARDITQRKRAEWDLAHAKDLAESASRELEAFSYSVAHDLRAPLRGMNGFAQVLLDTYQDKLDAEGRDWLNEIVLNAKRMGELIDALLSLARVTRNELKREPVDLSELVREALARLASAEPERTVELSIQPNLSANVDLRLTRVAFDNLTANAWKFTGKTVGARIEFAAAEQQGELIFSLKDNGAGFDMAFAKKLFAPFQRLHSAHEFPGTGIGLATAQRIVHRHGGRIWAEGIVDGGATFHFTFPTRSSSNGPREGQGSPARSETAS